MTSIGDYCSLDLPSYSVKVLLIWFGIVFWLVLRSFYPVFGHIECEIVSRCT